MIIETPVTQSVLEINGSIPNSPFKGCHLLENNNSEKDDFSITGSDLKIKPAKINRREEQANIVKNNIVLPAILSLRTLLKIIEFI